MSNDLVLQGCLEVWKMLILLLEAMLQGFVKPSAECKDYDVEEEEEQ